MAFDDAHTGGDETADVSHVGGHNQGVAFCGQFGEGVYVLFGHFQINGFVATGLVDGVGHQADGVGAGLRHQFQGFGFALGTVDASHFFALRGVYGGLGFTLGFFDFGFALARSKVDLLDF